MDPGALLKPRVLLKLWVIFCELIMVKVALDPSRMVLAEAIIMF